MANVKITALTAYGTEHGDDLVPIVDVHDTTMFSSGTDKGATIHKIFGSPSSGQILAWSGSSTGVPVGLSSLTWDGTNIVCAAPFHTQTGTSSEIAAIFKGRSGQSVDLVQIQDSTAAVLASINSVGIYKGPRAFAYASKTGTYVATLADGVIACDATSGAFAVTLPSESTAPDGFELIIEKTDSSANAVTVTADGSDTINGASTYALSAVYQYVRITADGGGKWIVNGAVSSGGGGTVTSVTFTGDGTVLSSTPSGAVTSSGTVTASLIDQTAHYVLAGPTTGSAAVPTFRTLIAADLPGMVASGSSHAAGIVPDPGATSGTTKYLREDATWAVPPGGGGGGTVTSVTFTGDGTVLSSTPSDPVTGSGTLTASLNTQTAHYVLAGPTSAGPSAPTFRALLAGDLPVLGNTAAGIAPNPEGADNTRFLRADATWSVPLGGNQNPNTVFAGPIVTPAAAPTFRSLVYGDLPIMVAAGLAGHAPGAVPDPGAVSSGGTKFLCDNATWAVPPGTYTPPGSGPGSGTVTSVGFEGDGTVLSTTISGPITSSGTLVASLKTQAANKVFAGPTTGADAAPTFRSLVGADLPSGYSRLIYSQATTVTVTSNGETTLINTTGSTGSLVLNANYLVAGRSLRFRFGGYYTSTASPNNWPIGVKLGTAVIATTLQGGPPASMSGAAWTGEILIATTVGGGAGTSKVWASGLIIFHATTPTSTGFLGISPGSAIGTWLPSTAGSPDLTSQATLDLRINISVTSQSISLTHLTIESLG